MRLVGNDEGEVSQVLRAELGDQVVAAKSHSHESVV